MINNYYDKLSLRPYFSIYYRLFILLLLSCISFNSSFAQSTEEKRDSLLNLIQNETEDTTKAKHYCRLMTLYRPVLPSQSIEYGETALKLSKKRKDNEGITRAYRGLFYSYYFEGASADTLLLYIQKLEKHTETNFKEDKKKLLSIYWLYGIYYRNLSQHDKEIEAYIKALEIAKYVKDINTQSKLLNNIGSVLDSRGRYPEALKYYKEGLEIVTGNISKANMLYNCGSIYDSQQQFDTAKIYFEEAYKYYEKEEHIMGMIQVLLAKGDYHDMDKEFEKAYQIYSKALQLINDNGFKSLRPSAYEAFANHYYEQKKYHKAIEYGERTIQETQDRLLFTYPILQKSYAAIGNYKKAYEIRGELMLHKDSVRHSEELNKVEELAIEYETKEKEQQIKVQQLELAQSTTQRNFLSGTALAFLLIGGLSVWYFRNRNQLLEKDLDNKKIIENQAKELKILYDSKNRFFANIAHELRTPLTLIEGPVTHVIQKNHLSIAASQSLGIVARNINYLKQLVNQILDLSKSEVKELSIQVTNFKLSELLKALVEDFQSYATYQKIDFNVPNNLENDIELTTDGEKLFITLKNLLSNAFKYTDSGGQVFLNYMDMGDVLQVSVEDTGRGISTSDVEHIFKPYFQTSDINTPIEGGTGIGLAICKEYIEKLNGTILVNSELNKGTTFIIQIPKRIEGEVHSMAALSFVKKQNKQSNTSLPTATSNHGQTLLIVEDNPDICQYLQSILQENYQLIFANNGAEGLKKLDASMPDLILTDLMMPVMDGFEFVEEVKKVKHWQQIPIITLTARSEMIDKLTALRIGVDDYLLKPFNEEELQIRIKKLLEHQDNRKNYIEELNENELAHTVSDAESDTELPMHATFEISRADKEWLQSLEDIVGKRVGSIDFNVYQLCLEVTMSSSQLYRKLKALTGLTPKKYIDQIRYHKARKLLETKPYPSIKKVAYDVGFKDEKHFARNFKKRYGKYPSEYLV